VENTTKQDKQLVKVIENAKRYPHAILETMTYHEDVNKYGCFIRCTKCESEDREVYTSDLRQVTLCETCAKQAKKEKKAAKRAAAKEAKQLAKASA
jgi:hypothetical protein